MQQDALRLPEVFREVGQLLGQPHELAASPFPLQAGVDTVQLVRGTAFHKAAQQRQHRLGLGFHQPDQTQDGVLKPQVRRPQLPRPAEKKI